MNPTDSKSGSPQPADSDYKFGGRTNSRRRRGAPGGERNPDRLATSARLTFIVLGLIAFAYLARVVVLPVLIAWVTAMTLKSPMRWLARCHVPVPLAAAVVMGVFIAGVSFAALNLGRPALAWIASAPESLPRLRTRFEQVLQPAARFRAAASSVGTLDPATGAVPGAPPIEVKDNRVATSVFSWTSSLLAGVGETLVLMFLLLAAGDTFLHKLVQTMPRLRDKKQAVEISREIQHSVSTYLFSVGLINLVLGAGVGLALHLAGMPNALMWGGVVACANFIPYFGPLLGILSVGVAGLLSFDALGRGLLPAGIYFAGHFVEANLITPHILGRRFTLNPVVIFVALIFGTWLWGVAGALLAVPLLVTGKVVCDHVPSLHVLGNFLASHKSRESESEASPPVNKQTMETVPVVPFFTFL